MKTTTILLLATAALAGCNSTPPTTLEKLPPSNTQQRNHSDDPTKDPGEKVGGESGGPGNTFDHNQDLGAYGGRSPFDILAERQAEGPPEVRTRLHSCQKLPVASFMTILTSFGVNMNNTGKNPPSAADLLKAGGGALGAADYDARVAEATTWSAAGAAKTFDIFMQAAPEIIANFSTLAQCKRADGSQPDLFDGNNKCNIDALSCLIGKPARQAHVDICNTAVAQASSIDTGKAIAVATILSAAHSCE